MSSSPVSIRGISPTRRRSLSPSEISEITSRPPRHSPTLVRSYDLNDPQVRERQRTMDVDMAMQLSLARRETLQGSPVATFSSPVGAPSGYHDPSQPAALNSDHSLSGRREVNDILDDLEPSRGQDFEIDNIYEPSVDGDTLAPHTHQPSLQRLQDPSLLGHHEHPSASNFGLPTYQANVSRSHFDFSRMEEFAVTEKSKLGLNSPITTRFSINAIRGRPKVHTDAGAVSAPVVPLASGSGSGSALVTGPDGTTPLSNEQPLSSSSSLPQAGEESAQAEASSRPLRHRKLSQSNPHPRSHRKGIGGKMALFESNSHENPSSFSARLGMVLGGQNGLPSGPSYDHIAGVPTTSGLNTGILNTGHDRPYRFSFYSNALSATIHARSLSELPAEGQTFEQLFSGVQPVSPTTTQPKENGAPKDRPPSSMGFSPPYQETIRPTSQNASESGSYFPNNGGANRRSLGGLAEKLGAANGMNSVNVDQDGSTWWLDVQSPTDEEMKMLSKV